MTKTSAGLDLCLWRHLQRHLDAWNPAWRDRIGGASTVEKLDRRQRGGAFSDDEIFEGLLLAVLSGNTLWSTIERLQPQLAEPFDSFSMSSYARRSDEAVASLVPWFLERRAGSTGLRASLLRLRQTVLLLDRYSREHGSADAYFTDALRDSDQELEELAVAVGSSKRWKLPGFGIALTAEALRNIGYDLCKPDRHVLRCLAAWDLVRFSHWPARSEFTAPQATPAELKLTMRVVRRLAHSNGVGVSYMTSAIWLAGAQSGARLSNEALRAIRQSC